MTVVVHTRVQVFGPFADGNEALHWLRVARLYLSVDVHGTMAVMDMVDPTEIVGAAWRVPKSSRDLMREQMEEREERKLVK